MDFLALAESRYSVRKFSGRPVEEEKIAAVLEAGRLAPTARNFQPQRIFLVRSEEAMEKYRACTPCHYGAPVGLVVCYDKNTCYRKDGGKDSGDIDCSIVITHMMLEAEEQGLGSTWLLRFDAEAVKKLFALPEELEPVSLLNIGYAAEDAAPSPMHTDRKPLTETVITL